jgi:hypothetical protein
MVSGFRLTGAVPATDRNADAQLRAEQTAVDGMVMRCDKVELASIGR